MASRTKVPLKSGKMAGVASDFRDQALRFLRETGRPFNNTDEIRQLENLRSSEALEEFIKQRASKKMEPSVFMNPPNLLTTQTMPIHA